VKAILGALALVLVASGCSTVPKSAYFPGLSAPATVALSHSLYRAAEAAGDDPRRYSFALVRTEQALAWSDRDATFYFSDGLVRLPAYVVEPMVAREVAHEVLAHYGVRRTLSLSISAGFTALGFVFPGASLMDLVVNPVVVRVFTRGQEYAADRKAVEILPAMGYPMPRRALARALVAVDRLNSVRRGSAPAAGPEAGIEGRLAALGPLEAPGRPAATDLFVAR
jgi:Zn-dependent protease with chaperone function